MNLIRRLKSKELSLLTIFKAISRPLIISQLTSVRDSNLSLRILFFFFFARTHHYRSSFHTNVEKQICLSTTTIREWPRIHTVLFSRVSLYIHMWCIEIFHQPTSTREKYTQNIVRARHVYEHTQRYENVYNDYRPGCSHIYKYKEKSVISSSGAAGRYKSWKWSLQFLSRDKSRDKLYQGCTVKEHSDVLTRYLDRIGAGMCKCKFLPLFLYEEEGTP